MNSETVFGVAAGRYYDAFHGEDPVETYWNLRRKAVLYDVPEKPWQIEGPGVFAVRFLPWKHFDLNQGIFRKRTLRKEVLGSASDLKWTLKNLPSGQIKSIVDICHHRKCVKYFYNPKKKCQDFLQLSDWRFYK